MSVKRLRINTFYDTVGIVKSFLWDDPVEIDCGVYLGNVSHSFFNSTLENFDIRAVVNVTKDVPNYYDPGIEYFNIRIGDLNDESIIGELEKCYHFLEKNVDEGRNTLIHCVFGRSRSVAVCLFYLMKRHRMSFDEAYEKIESLKPIINLNVTFARELQNYFNESRHLAPPSP